ncbi:MAG: hypothetical protein LBQ66_04525 [Planctomycetaceae bacterium]|jgi:hypothetical protein|nr:hypothetical protein [Planctomycetaceae bacterium]
MSFGFSPMMPGSLQDVKSHERKVDSNERTAQAQGIGGEKESSATSEDRDANGQQAWQWNQHKPKQEQQKDKKPPHDPSGQIGSTLDLNG